MNQIKEKVMKNIGFKLLAFIISLLLWIIIINIEDPIDVKVFNNISVTTVNENTIRAMDKVYEVVSGGTVSIKVKAKTSVLARIKAADLKATADLAEMSMTGAVLIKPSCPKYENKENLELTTNIQVMTIRIEDKETEQFKVTVDTKGTVPEEGYAIGSISVKPNLIKVSGPKSQIKRISEVRVEVDVTGATGDFTKRLEPSVYDANGKQMDSSGMEFSSSLIRVNVQILETKIVPISVTTKGNPAQDYYLYTVEYEPRQIEVAGSVNRLYGINDIPIEIDITDKKSDMELEINLADHIPEGIKIVGDIQTIMVRISIGAQKVQTILFSIEDIELRNVQEDMKIEIEKLTNPLEVQLVDQDKILTVTDIKPYIDCHGIKEGIQIFDVKFDITDDVLILKIPSITVKAEKRDISEPTPEKTMPPVTDQPEPTKHNTILETPVPTQSIPPTQPIETEPQDQENEIQSEERES